MSDYDEDDVAYLDDSDGEDYFEETPDTADGDHDYSSDNYKGKRKSIEYETLHPRQLDDLMNLEVERLVNVSGLDRSISSILCRYFRWNAERLLEKYMDSPFSVLKAIGESPSALTSAGEPRPPKRARKSASEVTCGICCSSYEEEDFFKLRCGHKFCKECWKWYVRGKVRDEGQSTISCMEEKCYTILGDEDIKNLTDMETFERFKELLRESFVKASPHLKFCPYPSCSCVVSCRDATVSSLSTIVPVVICSVSPTHKFCFGCGMDEDHRPAICKAVSLWKTNAREDAGTSEWIRANTRMCPKCGQSIEKNGGCNRLSCRHCSHQFCWVCRANWESHGYHNKTCNAFSEPVKSDPETNAKANLERWLFYFDRWNNHELSARLDEKMYEQAEEKIKEVQDASGMSWIQAQFMKQAVDELTRCRVTLKWTYTMAFFLSPGNSKQMFEDIQADLEKAVEDLSQLLEEEIEESNVTSLRQRMVDKTVYVQKRHAIVVEDTAKGLLEGRWEWTIPIE